MFYFFSNSKNTRKKGSRAEKIAHNYLTKNGYKVIKCNYFKKTGEIDIIALDKNFLVFIEVKSRFVNYFSSSIEPPESAVSFKKIQRLKKTAQLFLYEERISLDKNIRFDVISLIISRHKVIIKHFKHAF